MSESEVRLIDLRPSQAYSGGAMIPEGDYEIVDAHFGPWDYNGTRAVAVPGLCVVFKGPDQTYTQWYSAGDMKNLEPYNGGKNLKAVGSSTSLNNQCNCFQFLTSLVRAGFDDELILHDITTLNGLKVKVVHEPTIEREIAGEKKKAGSMAVVGKILFNPHKDKDAKTAKGKPAAAATAKTKSNGADTSDAGITEKTTTTLISVLKGAGKPMEKKEVSSAMWTKIPGNDTDRSKMMNLIIQDSYLSSLTERGVLYDQPNAQVIYVGD